MKLLTILACLFQGLFEFSDAQCRFYHQNTFCQGVDSKAFLHEFYENFREENMAETNSIKISRGNWSIIDYFPRLSIRSEDYTITNLSINDASIQQIDERAFEDLRNLKSLDLSHNQLEITLFIKYLPSLEKLNLASNKIVNVAFFTQLLFLSHLDMSNNRIRCLDFRKVYGIRELDFSKNNIDSLLDTDPRNYVGTSVNLSRNKIVDFNETEYSQIYQSLDLSFNNLNVVELVHNKIFLNLSNCNISRFVVRNSQRLCCEELDLSKCQCGTNLGDFINVSQKLKNRIDNDTQAADVTKSLQNLAGTARIIDLSHSSITNIPAFAFGNFQLLELLNLSHMNIRKLNSFTFKSTSLNVLDLSHSHIKVLQANVFKGLTSKVINLSFNEISDVKNKFHEVKAITIDLSFNALRTIGNHSFENCDILSEISLSNCFIEKIEPLAFIRLDNLRLLDLSNNKLLILERNTFHDLPVLELNLGGNKITTIRSRAFSALSGLRSLNLSSVHLHNLETNAFVNLSQIKSIDLSHNDLHIIPPQLFVDTPRLESIDFTYNNISTINRFSNRLKIANLSLSMNGTLASNTISNVNIRYFALENCRIETLRADCFQGMYNLEELHFKNSDIRFVESGTLNGLYNLYYLDSQNLFRHIEHIEKDTFRDLRSLKTLNLSGLFIQTIESNSFRGLSNIREILFSKNSLSRLIKDTFMGLDTLNVLDLSFNHIGKIDNDVFNPLKNLEVLYLQHNDISSIEPNHFQSMINLKKLRLDHNNITNLVPDSLSGLQNLQELHLGRNNLTGLAVGVFQQLSNLIVLNFNHNELKTLETGVFSNLVSLTVLDLTENSLNKLDEVGVFFSVRKLEQLFLDGNHLKSFDYERLTKNLRNIVHLGISHNKWQCKDLSMMIEHFSTKNINYEPKIPVFDSYNIDGVRCIDVCDYVYCQHEYVQPNGYQ